VLASFLPWFDTQGGETKTAASEYLDAMEVMVGLPEPWGGVSGLPIHADRR